MSNLQNTLNALKPYVIGIRYVGDVIVIDTIFKSGWTMPESNKIKRVKGEDEALNYYMIFSEIPNFSLDELLDYVANVIRINVDREKKHELLRSKVNELKEVFKKHTLQQLSRLKFIITDEELVPTLNEFDVDNIIEDDLIEEPPVQQIHEQKYTSPGIPATPATEIHQTQPYYEQHVMTEEEQEMMEEEARAENFRRMKEAEKLNGVSKRKPNVELPPRRKISEAIRETSMNTDCDCGPEEACDKCIDTK